MKPATLGSSVGMTRVKSAKELAAAMDFAAEFALKIVVERAVNAREIEVSVLGNDEILASMPGEIIPHREFYDYTAKYLEQGTSLVIPARLTKKQVEGISGLCGARLPRHRRHRHGSLRFFPRAAHREDFRQRAQHHPRLHLHQHVSEAVGSLRSAIPASSSTA